MLDNRWTNGAENKCDRDENLKADECDKMSQNAKLVHKRYSIDEVIEAYLKKN